MPGYHKSTDMKNSMIILLNLPSHICECVQTSGYIEFSPAGSAVSELYLLIHSSDDCCIDLAYTHFCSIINNINQNRNWTLSYDNWAAYRDIAIYLWYNRQK